MSRIASTQVIEVSVDQLLAMVVVKRRIAKYRHRLSAGLLPESVMHCRALWCNLATDAHSWLRKNNYLHIEPLAFNQLVAGSTPARPTNYDRSRTYGSLFRFAVLLRENARGSHPVNPFAGTNVHRTFVKLQLTLHGPPILQALTH